MKLARVYFSNGWSSLQFGLTELEIINMAKECYSVWFDDEPYVEKTVWIWA